MHVMLLSYRLQFVSTHKNILDGFFAQKIVIIPFVYRQFTFVFVKEIIGIVVV